MKLFLKTFGIILGIPALLLVVWFVVEKFLTQTDADVHDAMARHSATKTQLVAWLDSENIKYVENPVTELDKQNFKESKDYLWEWGVTPKEAQESSSYIYVSFVTRGWELATRNLQYRLLFDEGGKRVLSKSNAIYFGF